MKKYSPIFVLLLAVITLALNSCKKDPMPTEQFQRGANGVAVLSDGNIAIAGYNNPGNGTFKATIIKFSPSGEEIARNTYGNNSIDAFYNVKAADNGKTVAVGTSKATSLGSSQMMVVLAKSDLSQIFNTTYKGRGTSSGFGITRDSDTTFVAVGYTQTTTSDDRDIFVVRLNLTGKTIWEKTYGEKSTKADEPVNEEAYSIAVAPDGGYFLSGSCKGYNMGGGPLFLMKISAKGDSLWTKTYSVKGIGYSVITTADNKLLIGGSVVDQANNADIYVLKTDLDGVPMWNKTYSGSGYEYGANLVQAADGSFAIVGITSSKGAGAEDLLLIKGSSSTGDLIFSNTFGGTGNEEGFGLAALPDGGFCAAGLNNTDGSYIYVLKVDASGKLVWEKKLK